MPLLTRSVRARFPALMYALICGGSIHCRSSDPPTPQPERVQPPSVTSAPPVTQAIEDRLELNDKEYFELPGLNVMLGNDYYPEGHQGGLSIIQNGLRTASNGDIRLDRTPGQWQPVPKVGPRIVDRDTSEIRVTLAYPDPDKNRKGFNPIDYPDLTFGYTVTVKPEGRSFRVVVDLDQPLPQAWVGKVGFNLELFPGILFGKSYVLDETIGTFPRQATGMATHGNDVAPPLATGRRLTVAPESDRQRMTIEAVAGADLELHDGRGQHNNGWFIVRAPIPAGTTAHAIEWRIAPHAIHDWRHTPVLQISQVGYHPKQSKVAVIELDPRDPIAGKAILVKVEADGSTHPALEREPSSWGSFLRYRYAQFDFSEVIDPGLYFVRYGAQETAVFPIHREVFERGVWQPTLETFLPVQMCHMRVNDRYRVWHDFCHLDDARMAPTNHNHFDGYLQGPSTLTRYQPGDHVPGLDRGGWHDAGDHDLRVESQANTIYGLALAYEAFALDYDNTSIDQGTRVVELHQADGKPDILQQVEHGALSVIGGYRSLGRLYRGIITPTLRQYVLLGDPAAGSDNLPFDPHRGNPPVGLPGSADDNWVFTEENPSRELGVAAGLAAGSRVLRAFNPELASECLAAAKSLFASTPETDPVKRTPAATELLLATGDAMYADFLVAHQADIVKGFDEVGWIVGRSLPRIDDEPYRQAIRAAAEAHHRDIEARALKTPYGIPYEPDIWGAGWTIQRFGAEQYYLQHAFPDIYPKTYLLNALSFVLGCHPGTNTSSFVSGVGARSLTVAYGINRADESYIPGGIGSGTALIRPDFPELLDWPFLWQQTEYVLGYGTTDYLTLVWGAHQLLNE